MSKTVSARIPDALSEQLQATAKALGVTVSQLVSQAIATYVNTVNMADPAENLSLGQLGSHNRPGSAVNSPELVARLEMMEARLTALEQAVNSVNMAYTAGIPSLSEQTAINPLQPAVNSLSTPVNRDPNLAGMTVKELRKLAGERGIPRYWVMNKADLIAVLA